LLISILDNENKTEKKTRRILRRHVKFKELQLLHAAPVDQSEELGGGASVASFCLQLAWQLIYFYIFIYLFIFYSTFRKTYNGI